MNCKKCGKSILSSCNGYCQACLKFVPLKQCKNEPFHKKRMFHIEISCGADSLKDLEFALDNIIQQINKCAMDYFSCNKKPYVSVSGGYSSGWNLELSHNPEMTHDKYFDTSEEKISTKPEVNPPGQNPKGKQKF